MWGGLVLCIIRCKIIDNVIKLPGGEVEVPPGGGVHVRPQEPHLWVSGAAGGGEEGGVAAAPHTCPGQGGVGGSYSIYRGLTNQGGLDALNEELPGPEVAAAHVQRLSVLAPGLGRRPAIGPYVHMAALLVVANLLYYRIINIIKRSIGTHPMSSSVNHIHKLRV